MKKITLSRGKFALVDDADFDWLNQWKWYCSSKGYAIRTVNTLKGTGKKNSKTIHMHREIISETSLSVDHIDGNPLNNQRSNLRVCSHADNMRNRKHQKNSKCKYKGVSRVNNSSGYMARITVGNKTKYLGIYKTQEAAHQAYLKAAYKSFGEFANP